MTPDEREWIMLGASVCGAFGIGMLVFAVLLYLNAKGVIP